MERKAVFPPGRPSPNPPFSPGIRLGNLLFTAGQVGADINGQVPAEIGGQTRNTFENLKAVLAAGGSGLDKVLKATVYLTDINDFAAMNAVYRSYFTGDLPARTTVAVAALARPELHIEIEMIAYVPA
ncbi:MAG TPA: RidA family protein [bacterium]|nr:RidA family protein [bacterium]